MDISIQELDSIWGGKRYDLKDNDNKTWNLLINRKERKRPYPKPKLSDIPKELIEKSLSILNQQKANSEEKVGEGVYKQEAARVEEDRGGETRFSRIKSRAINFLINNWNQVANIFCQETGNLSPSTESLPFFSNVSLEKKYGVIDFIGLAHDRTVIVIRFIPPGNNGEIDVNKSIIIRNRLVDLLRIFPPTAIKVYKANVFENENKGQSSLIFIEE